VFEFGWFCGQIGREHVAVLYEPDVELPSDVTGVSYISLGEADWRVHLVADLRDAGLDFSMNYVTG
jgi:predicted nucleotide-binding protein